MIEIQSNKWNEPIKFITLIQTPPLKSASEPIGWTAVFFLQINLQFNIKKFSFINYKKFRVFLPLGIPHSTNIGLNLISNSCIEYIEWCLVHTQNNNINIFMPCNSSIQHINNVHWKRVNRRPPIYLIFMPHL